VRTAEGERLDAGAVVLAAGAWSTALARQAGVRVPMEAAKGYHVMLDRPSPCLEMAAVLAERFVAVNPMAGGLRLAGTLEFSGISARIVPRRAEALVRGARLYLDGIDSAPVRSTWCGLRPCTADGLPALGWAPGVGNLFVATGHAMMGFALGPLAGRAAAECVLDGRASIDLSPFDPARFTRGGSTAPRTAQPAGAA
jgi:D-amino-acid dehydrogenase